MSTTVSATSQGFIIADMFHGMADGLEGTAHNPQQPLWCIAGMRVTIVDGRQICGR
jgi:hypothetical protein